jgi:MFS transporter, DHA2 family, multidrug resistance protein
MRRVTEYFFSQGASPVDAQRQAVGWIGRLVLSHSTLLAYIDVFWACAAFGTLMIPIALLIRRIDAATRPALHV